jgi:hypothetical protein
LIPKICPSRYQQFLHDFFASAEQQLLGRAFLFQFFPGLEDPDISEESDFHHVTSLIEERYVSGISTSHGCM